MSYSDFTLEAAEREFGVMAQEADLFPALGDAPVPDWLPASLARGKGFALISEKVRSEFIVVPILLAARELCHDRFTIYSGQRLDVAPIEDSPENAISFSRRRPPSHYCARL